MPRAVICRLCFETKALGELSRLPTGEISDICLVCRESELRAVLSLLETILAVDDQLANPRYPDNEITQELSFKRHVGSCCKECVSEYEEGYDIRVASGDGSCCCRDDGLNKLLIT